MMQNITDNECVESDYYEYVLTPITANEEGKNGVTFRGSDNEYFKAHKMLVELTKKKGDKFLIKGVDISIADAPKNKPATISIKTKNGITGKANIKIYSKNRRGSASILVTKVRGGTINDVSNLAFKVVKPLLDDIISGVTEWEDINKMRKSKMESMKKCDQCDESFQSPDKLDAHTKSHRGKNTVGVLCGDASVLEKELRKHEEDEHSEISAPDAKRLREEIKKEEENQSEDNMDIDIVNEEKMDIDSNDEIVILSKLNDEKVIKMQKRFEEEEKLVKEMKRKKELDRLEEQQKKKAKRGSVKKKNKKKEQPEKLNKIDRKLKRKEIDRKYSDVMKKAGLDIN